LRERRHARHRLRGRLHRACPPNGLVRDGKRDRSAVLRGFPISGFPRACTSGSALARSFGQAAWKSRRRDHRRHRGTTTLQSSMKRRCASDGGALAAPRAHEASGTASKRWSIGSRPVAASKQRQCRRRTTTPSTWGFEHRGRRAAMTTKGAPCPVMAARPRAPMRKR